MRTRLIVAAIASLTAAFLIDRWAYDHMVNAAVYEKDWGRLFRVMGYWPTWGAAALALWLHQRGVVANAGRRALLLAGSPAVAALADEVVKLLIRRERPEPHDGDSVFRAFSDRPFSTSGLATPSSHTAVAFGAAAMLALFYPRARWVWFALAAGCGLTRVLARAHFMSDVVAAALLAIATTTWLWRRFAAPSSSAAPGSAAGA